MWPGSHSFLQFESKIVQNESEMRPYTPEYEDDKAFAVYQRTSGLVRASMSAGDEGPRRLLKRCPSRRFRGEEPHLWPGEELFEVDRSAQDEQSELDAHIACVDGKWGALGGSERAVTRGVSASSSWWTTSLDLEKR